jgi:hypothetical protein
MRSVHFVRAAALASLAAAVTPAVAVNCYAVVDRTNEVIYQDTVAPIDLSDEGDAARDALRAKGQQLITMNTERCPAIDRARIAGNGGAATVDEIVAGMRPAIPFGTAAARAATARDRGGVSLPQISVPRDTGGGMSVGGPPVGMSIR